MHLPADIPDMYPPVRCFTHPTWREDKTGPTKNG
jgi:hypothetical protein